VRVVFMLLHSFVPAVGTVFGLALSVVIHRTCRASDGYWSGHWSTADVRWPGIRSRPVDGAAALRETRRSAASHRAATEPRRRGACNQARDPPGTGCHDKGAASSPICLRRHPGQAPGYLDERFATGSSLRPGEPAGAAGGGQRDERSRAGWRFRRPAPGAPGWPSAGPASGSLPAPGSGAAWAGPAVHAACDGRPHRGRRAVVACREEWLQWGIFAQMTVMAARDFDGCTNPRSPQNYSSAPAPSNGTSARYSPNWASPPAETSTTPCPRQASTRHPANDLRQ
jgi:hypothetical protein